MTFLVCSIPEDGESRGAEAADQTNQQQVPHLYKKNILSYYYNFKGLSMIEPGSNIKGPKGSRKKSASSSGQATKALSPPRAHPLKLSGHRNFFLYFKFLELQKKFFSLVARSLPS